MRRPRVNLKMLLDTRFGGDGVEPVAPSSDDVAAMIEARSAFEARMAAKPAAMTPKPAAKKPATKKAVANKKPVRSKK